jgi:hypothetical protein
MNATKMPRESSRRLRYVSAMDRCIPPSWPPLYKYLPKEFARSLVERGEVQINTLEACRRTEDAERGDPGEGMRITAALHQSFKEGDSVDPFIEQFVGKQMGKGTRFIDCNFSAREIFENLFVYCVSLLFDRRLMHQFPGYDACVRILDPVRFFHDLAHALGARIDEDDWIAADCLYVGRKARL